MFISEIFSIEKGHEFLDFVDVDCDGDTKLYVDPTLIEYDASSIGRESHALIRSYFDSVGKAIRAENIDELRELSSYAHEPNETRLGMSCHNPIGKGSSPDILMSIYQSIMDQRLLDNGMIKKPADIAVVVENFGYDRMSDLITNIIKPALYRFTLQQCKKYNYQLPEREYSLGYWWTPEVGKWGKARGVAFMIDSRALLLVPKSFVHRRMIKNPDEFFRRIVIPHLQEEHLAADTSLVRHGTDSRGREWTKPPFKRDIRKNELEKGSTKDRIREYLGRNFTAAEEYDEFTRKRFMNQECILDDEQLDRILYGIGWQRGYEA